MKDSAKTKPVSWKFCGGDQKEWNFGCTLRFGPLPCLQGHFRVGHFQAALLTWLAWELSLQSNQILVNIWAFDMSFSMMSVWAKAKGFVWSQRHTHFFTNGYAFPEWDKVKECMLCPISPPSGTFSNCSYCTVGFWVLSVQSHQVL